MTLHDLSNSPVLQNVAAEVFENEVKVVEIMKQIQPQKIRMKSKYIFNMVGTSLVLGLYPASEADYIKLMELYEMFNEELRKYVHVETGEFGADMDVLITNIGPTTIWLEK